ncbi:hypothetical protein J31TS4_27740 [Paenibacillus sp. J31TS4]|uniref:extracellular solute-binding protein n=1 Tax=Paenibacillus sp. J31TS4 TaxID=2807195 RepID=UPI001B223ADC|nr:extracellular solute-binding protein [Paenibacillus sp. J31TS4]GIP39494.1 hypothetical protein J31TS4_27740 [Paenibacillus sp. J31TS4]
MARISRVVMEARVRELLDSLRNDLEEGRLRPGGYLPSEVELGAAFRLSKESVRKALDELVAEGRIEKIRRVGNKVTERGGETPLQGKKGEPAPAEKFAPRGGGAAAAGGKHTWTTDDEAKDREASRAVPEAVASGRAATVGAETRTRLRLAYHPLLEKEAALPELAARFEARHPGCTVELLPTPFPHAYAEHGLADVFTLSAWDALKLRDRDPALSLLGEVPETNAAHPKLLSPFRDSGGRVAAAPLIYSPVVLCYNRDHFREAGVEEPEADWTWYSLLRAARHLSRTLDVWGFAVHIQSVNRWPVFLLQNGFRFRQEEGKRASDDPALWESLRLPRDLLHQQRRPQPLLTENDSDVERWFREGKASMIMTTYFGLNGLLSSNLRYGIAPLPRLRTADTLLLVTGLAIRRGTEAAEEAAELVRFLCGEEAQTGIRRETLSPPAHPAAQRLAEGLRGNRPEAAPVLDKLWPDCREYGDLRLGAAVLEAVREELKAYWSRLEDEGEASERLEHLGL